MTRYQVKLKKQGWVTVYGVDQSEAIKDAEMAYDDKYAGKIKEG